MGIINIGGEGTVTVDGKKYTLGFQEALYVGRGAKNIEVSSKDAAKPAKFYMNSACAHQTYPTKKVTLKDANNIKAGSLKESNDRVIHQLIIDGVAGIANGLNAAVIQEVLKDYLPKHLKNIKKEVDAAA